MASTRENLVELIKNLEYKLTRATNPREIDELTRRLKLAREGMATLRRLDKPMGD